MLIVFLLLIAVLLIIGLTSKRKSVKLLSGFGLFLFICLSLFVVFALALMLVFFMNH